MRLLFAFFFFFTSIVIVLMGCSKTESSSGNDSIIFLNKVNAKVFRVVQVYDSVNQPEQFTWSLSTNELWVDSTSTPLDKNILAPVSLPVPFQKEGLKVIVSGRKYINKDHALSMPNLDRGFGYVFEITEIAKKE